ncbi:unnamed protein product, partial [Didymodactylos carnosus]
MDGVDRITQLLRERTLKELPVPSSLTQVQEEELVDQLFNVFESTSTSYNEDDETTLDHNMSDDEIDGCEEGLDESSHDLDYEEKDEENPVFESFSLSYMKRALEYYDAIN